jgi:hypothetical protein
MRRDFPLHLETSTDIFLPGFKVHVVGKDGLKTHKSYKTKNIVRGYIEGNVNERSLQLLYYGHMTSSHHNIVLLLFFNLDERDSAVLGHMLDGIFRGVIRSQG